jgi:preprotein translocase subunit SecE
LVVGSSPTARAKTKNMSQITSYIKDSYAELVTKVTWPSWKSLQESSILVFVASLLIAGTVFAMDWAFGVNVSGSAWKGVVGFIYDLPNLF